MKVKGKYNNFYGKYKIGKGTRIGSFCDIGGIIGKDCKIQSYVFIPPGVEIGDRVFIGPGVRFTNNKRPDLKKKDWKPEETFIEDNVVIGAGAIILPVRIGRGAIIGAGSVVLEDIMPYDVWVGVPAKFKKSNCPRKYKKCIWCGQCL